MIEKYPKLWYCQYMKINYAVMGRHIKEIRSARGITQAELAEMVDRSTTFITHIENGKKHPGLETLVMIATALGSTVDEILLGNQPGDRMTYYREIREIFDGCDSSQKDFILLVVRAVKDGFKHLEIK